MLFTSEIVNCTLSPWSEWSDCTETCRFEDKTSKRQIAQEAAHGGYNCSGDLDLTKVESCDRDDLCGGNYPITLGLKFVIRYIYYDIQILLEMYISIQVTLY